MCDQRYASHATGKRGASLYGELGAAFDCNRRGSYIEAVVPLCP